MPGFTPARLELARRRRGFTKATLSQKVEVSVRSLTDYESGVKGPSAATLERLAEALDFPAGFFSRPKIDSLSATSTSFRALSRTTSSKRDQALGAGTLALDLAQWIDSHFRLPNPSIPRYEGVDPETAAEAVRSEWGLGERSIPNLIHLLEAHGVRVFSLTQEGGDIDAFSCWRDDVPYVFLNTLKSAERSRMDAAHELGHLILHSGGHEIPRGRDEEHEAKLFGSAFLMPRGSVLAGARRGSRIDELIQAKRRWKVSLASLAYRMHRLGLLSDWQYKSIFIEISRRGYHTSEPDSIAGETSQVLAKVFRALRDEGMSQVDVARALEIRLEELRKLVFGLALTGIDGPQFADHKSRSESQRPVLQVV
jgi:Zn-dependent peptidase ImmA (M78 family)/DNA-binding XRE family transcriptional regulator